MAIYLSACRVAPGDFRKNYIVVPSIKKIALYSNYNSIARSESEKTYVCDSIYKVLCEYNSYSFLIPLKPKKRKPKHKPTHKLNKIILGAAILNDDYVVDFSNDLTLNFWNIETKQIILTKQIDLGELYHYPLNSFCFSKLVVLANGLIIVKLRVTTKIVKVDFINNNKINCDVIDFLTEYIEKIFSLSNCQIASTYRDDNNLYIWK